MLSGIKCVFLRWTKRGLFVNARKLAKNLKAGIYDKDGKVVMPECLKVELIHMLNELSKRRALMSKPRKR